MERKIASYQHNGRRYQLIRITNESGTFKYQIRINRKVTDTYYIEWTARKAFAAMMQNDILQLNIYEVPTYNINRMPKFYKDKILKTWK